MSQSALAIANEPGANFRADVNTALQALASQSSGATAPATTYPYQYWYDTTLNVLKIRNSANSAWVILGPEADSTQNVLYTNNAARTYTDSTGQTGFGVPTPGYKVDVSGDANVSGVFRVAGTAQTNAARSTIASNTTTDLGSVNSSGITISGTTTVTSFGSTAAAGIIKYVTLSGAVPITYNATSMILPGGVSITGAAGDTFVAESLGSGNWRVNHYQRADGTVNGSALAGFRNLLCNPAMEVWQRNTTFTPAVNTNTYTADRWCALIGTSDAVTYSRIAPSLTGFRYAMRVQRTAANTGTNAVYIAQGLETTDSIKLQGLPVTLSFWARAGANYSASSSALVAAIVYGTGTDENILTTYTGATNVVSQNVTLTTSWQRFTVSGTVNSAATEVGVRFQFTPTGTAGAADNFDITGVQLENSLFATPFEIRPFPTELAMCQRYYAKTFLYGTAPAQNAGTTGSLMTIGCVTNQTIGVNWKFPVTMRAAPTITTYSPDAATANWSNQAGVIPTAAPQTIGDSSSSLRGTTSVFAGGTYEIHAQAVAEL